MSSRLVILLIFVVSLVLGVPVWWMTTNVYRADIPILQQWQTREFNAIPIRVQVHIIHPAAQKPPATQVKHLTAAFEQTLVAIAKSTRKFAPLSIERVFSTTSDEKVPQLNQKELDLWLQNSIMSASVSSSRSGHYSIAFIIDPTVKQMTATIGSRRHAWITLSDLEDAAAFRPVFETQLRHLLVNDAKIDRPRKQSYRFTFSLLNEDPSATIPTWNFSSLAKQYLSEVIPTLERVHSISVDSQVVHYTQLKMAPSFDATTKQYYYTPASLPHFVDGTEWKVDSGSEASVRSLHFGVFVPSPSHSPLSIRHSRQSDAIGFVIPQWGGIVIHNVAKENEEKSLKKNETNASDKPSSGSPISNGSSKRFDFGQTSSSKIVFSTFVSQMRQLLALPAFTSKLTVPKSSSKSASTVAAKMPDTIEVLSAGKRGASDFEVDALKRRQFWSMYIETQHTLTQFQLMIEQMINIPIHDNIHDTMTRALEKRAKAIELLSSAFFAHDKAYDAIADALIASEEVFFDKDMVGMLYFPSGHELAIYLPLFLPLCFPLITGFRAEIARRRQKRASKSS